MSMQTTVLLILDGWGYSESVDFNAINEAETPHWDDLWRHCPHTLLQGAGRAVGLPEGQMGNSEVGHLNIGAGRCVNQEYTRISQATETGEFFENETLLHSFAPLKQSGGKLHILGLLSPGGVHSHETHLHALCQMASQHHLPYVVHAILDGRDTPPKSAAASLQNLDKILSANPGGQVASLIGRYYAMDRDQRWDRIEKAYRLIAEGLSEYKAITPLRGLEAAYAREETDEFVSATAIQPNGEMIRLEANDLMVFMNFRADRARQITKAFTQPNFDTFARPGVHPAEQFICLTQYDKNLPAHVAYPPLTLSNGLGEIFSQQKLKQLRIAETEKYAHVTFFFNGGVEEPLPLEDRQLIPSPQVATYDLQPEMSAPELTRKLCEAITSKTYGLIVCNFANPDMVGHTGNFKATVAAIEAVDDALGKIIAAAKQSGAELFITADHGNAECMYDLTTQQPHTAHTTEPVPLLYVGRPAHFSDHPGTLADVAPTILASRHFTIPEEMTGQSLLVFDDE